jgi:alpha-L-arabinofuranosidase
MKKILTNFIVASIISTGFYGCITTPEQPKDDATTCTITIDASKELRKVNRADLMGINIAVYHSSKDYQKAINGPLSKLKMGLVRMPGGSVSDRYYWNGNGVLSADGTVDKSKFKPFEKQGYWQIDYSGYKPGFSIDANDWSKINPGFIQLDVKKMHEITREHPIAHNLVTVNMGTGTPELAAEWVRWANKTNNYGVKYWELGNELNGGWEAGHITADGTEMTPEKYVKRFIKFVKAMKAVDPTIKVGGPSCDVDHHDDYFSPLLRDAGKYVDFLTLHYYSLRSSIAPEKELFLGLDKLKPVVKRLDELVNKYQPERKDEIKYCISEWNSKLPKDQDAYRLFNGLWFSGWVGEMVKEGVDSATVWDIFSGKENGHGLLVRHGNDYVPTGRYWAFYLWSHYMADTLVSSSIQGGKDLHVYTTKDKENLYVMIMNESRSVTEYAGINIKDFAPVPTGEEITLSSREYFWNPYTFEADWNSGPSEISRKVADKMTITVPPYCVKIIKLSSVENSDTPAASEDTGKPSLKILLPESEFCDMEVEGWVRAFKQGTNKPYELKLGTVKLSVKGAATITPSELDMSSAASRFVLKPSGKPGKITIIAECGDLKAEKTINFTPVHFQELVAWNFENGKIEEAAKSQFEYKITKIPGSKSKGLMFDLSSGKESANHLIDITAYPKGVPASRIGGVVFDLILPESLKVKADQDKPASIEAVLQSTGAYWIPCGKVKIDSSKGTKQTIKLEIADKKFLKVMDKAFSIIFLIDGKQSLSAPIFLDNIGFLLRPEKK